MVRCPCFHWESTMPRTPTPRILMKRAQKNVTPHAVYRFFDSAGILLYVGCTSDPKKRCVCHRTQSTWAMQIERVNVKWFPGWLQAARAEAEAIMNERPKHNRISPLPANVGIGYVPHPRGDGSHCPKCGKPGNKQIATTYHPVFIQRHRKFHLRHCRD